MTKTETIEAAKKRGGFFTVDRNSYSADKMRKKLKAMSKDNNCPLKFYAATQKEVVYSL